MLALGHTVIAPDLLGHGESDGPVAVDYSLGGHAGMLRDLLDELGHRRVTVVGHSLGGGIAMTFAYHYPERVERLALISSGGLGRGVSPALRAATLPGAGAVMRTVGARPVVAIGRGLCAALAGSGLRRPARTTLELVRTLERLGDSGRRGAFLNTVRAVIDGLGRRSPPSIGCTSSRPFRCSWCGAPRIVCPGRPRRAGPRDASARRHRPARRNRPYAAPVAAGIRRRTARRVGPERHGRNA